MRPFGLERSGETGINYKTGISGEHARPGQRLRPTAERKANGENQPEEPQRGWELTGGALRQSEHSSRTQLRGCDQSLLGIGPRTRSRTVDA